MGNGEWSLLQKASRGHLRCPFTSPWSGPKHPSASQRWDPDANLWGSTPNTGASPPPSQCSPGTQTQHLLLHRKEPVRCLHFHIYFHGDNMEEISNHCGGKKNLTSELHPITIMSNCSKSSVDLTFIESNAKENGLPLDLRHRVWVCLVMYLWQDFSFLGKVDRYSPRSTWLCTDVPTSHSKGHFVVPV